MFKIRTVPLKQGPAVAMAVIGMCAEFCRVIEEGSSLLFPGSQR